MDNLKKYLQQHSNELDSDAPGDAVWQRIEKSATPILPKKNVVKVVWRYAAAACVLACIAAVFFLVNKKDTAALTLASNVKDTNHPSAIVVLEQLKDVKATAPATIAKPTQPTPEKTAVTKENNVALKRPKKEPKITKRTIILDPAQLLIQDVERNYTQLVNYQLQRLKVTPVYAESPNYFSTFKQQLKQIETDETTIKKDIKLHGLNDELLQQLININQQKLTVLKDLQTEIGKLNNKVKSPANRADSSQAFYLTM